MSTATQVCPYCSGTGWRTGESDTAVVPCECRAATRVSRALAAARIPPRYVHCSFPHFDTNKERGGGRNDSLWKALGEANKFVTEYPLGDGKGLIFIGEPGVGKTHLAMAALKGVIEKGAEGLFVDYAELLKQLQSSYSATGFTPEHQLLQPVLQTELVLIDDLGNYRLTDWSEDTVNYILNYRYNQKKVTLFTSNVNEDLMAIVTGKTATQVLGERVASRLHEMCRIVKIAADDYRQRTR